MKRIIAMAVVSSSLIFSCSNSTITQSQESPKPILVNENIIQPVNLSEIDVNLGEEFVIVLDGNPTTGYQWMTENIDEAFIKFLSSKYEPSSNTPGSGGRYVWTFRAVAQGKSNITMKYLRPWEKDIEPIKKQVFSININEPTNPSVLRLNFFSELKRKMGF